MDVIVIGAGQAGLAMSRCLARRGVGHVVLERGRVGERWRRERWDSFTLLSPNWQTRLPERAYSGSDPDGFMTGFRARVDGFVARTGLEAPPEPARLPRPAPWASEAEASLDLGGIGTVIWATGFRRDFSWVHAPVLDAAGEPVHDRGVTAAEGLFFLGLKWLHRRSSSFLDGVGADAEYLAEYLADQLAGASRSSWRTRAASRVRWSRSGTLAAAPAASA